MSKKSQFGMTLLLSTILVGGANASTVSTSNTLGATMIAQQGAVCKGATCSEPPTVRNRLAYGPHRAV